MEQALAAEIDRMLGREAYVQREKVASWVEAEEVCQRCKITKSLPSSSAKPKSEFQPNEIYNRENGRAVILELR